MKKQMQSLPVDKKTDFIVSDVGWGNRGGVYLSFEGFNGNLQLGRELKEKMGIPQVGDLVTAVIKEGYYGLYLIDYKPTDPT
jgi:ABC-type lipoprotein release transport system permease subunit